MKISNNQSVMGGIESISAYLIWGLSPLFWVLISGVSPWIIICNRITWSCVMMLIIVLAYKQMPEIKKIFHNKKDFFTLFFCGWLIFCNWSVYIWAICNERVLDASLGYYINPLMVIFLSKIFLKEKFDNLKIFSIVIAATGIGIMIFKFGTIPYVSLSLCSTFAIYGLIKKRIKYSAVQTMFVENLVVTPFALAYLLSSPESYSISFPNYILLICGGIVTGIPLLLFASGVKKIKLSTQGYIQFLAPTITFFLSIFVFKENINQAQLTALLFIWTACGVFIISLFTQKKNMQKRTL